MHEQLTLNENLGLPMDLDWVRAAHIFNCLCCVVFWLFFFVCLRPLSCVPNVSSISGVFIIDCPLGSL